MKLVMTLVVRNEADIIDAQIAFHLNAGVDFIIASDNGSDDGTREILESYAKDGHLVLVAQPDPRPHQVHWVTKLARLAASDFAADWVINSDGDEFWWPRRGTFKEIFANVPPRFGSVRGMWRHFVPRPGPPDFASRMIVRLCVPVTGRHHQFNPHFKTAHRADPEVVVGGGNHDASGARLLPIYGWYPIDVLHFPVRSLEQCENKYVQHYEWSGRRDPHLLEPYTAYREGRFHEFYESLLVGDRELDEGLRNHELAIDVRLRDALRRLRIGGTDMKPCFATGRTLTFEDQPVDRDYLLEVGMLEDHTTAAQAERRVDALESKLSALA
jgi:Glycosyl transferase family 2